MPIVGPSQPQNLQSQSIQNQRPANLGVIYSGNPAVDRQRVQAAVRKKAVNEYNNAVAQYNSDLAAYNQSVKEQVALRAQIQAKNQDFARRAQTGNLTPSEFGQTTFAADIRAKYGPDIGGNLIEAAYYDYLLQFPNPNYKMVGGSNRQDLEYARAVQLRDVRSALKLKEREAQAMQPGYSDRLAAQQTLKEFSKKPVLTAQDVSMLNRAYEVLGLPRPDYSGTITRRDGTKENYRNGMLVSVKR